MSNKFRVKFLRGSAAQNNTYVGLAGELTIDLTNKALRFHDATKAGGWEIPGTEQVQSWITTLEETVNAHTGDLGDIETAINDINTELGQRLHVDLLGAADGGVPTLDATGKIPTSFISDAVLGQVEYMGTWNASTNTPALPATPDKKGDYYVVTTPGTFATIDFLEGDWIISKGDVWEKVSNTGNVVSVNGYKGVVTLAKADVGLANVDNTSDANKPVSTAQQTALDLKANVDSPTLTGTPTAPNPAAESSNQQIATSKFVTDRISDINRGVLSVDATLPLTVTGTNDARTFAINEASQSAAGSMSSEDKTKLDGIETGAQVNVDTNLSLTGTGDSRVLESSTGTNANLPVADGTNAGLMSMGHYTKLEGVEAGAQVNTVTTVAGRTGAVVVNKADVGLSDVENYGLATQEEAELGQVNNKYMTPQRTKQFVTNMGLSYNSVDQEWVMDLGELPVT